MTNQIVHINLLRSVELLFQEVHADTTGSILDDDRKYGASTLGSTCDDDGKYTSLVVV
jgi:hypothetical protein